MKERSLLDALDQIIRLAFLLDNSACLVTENSDFLVGLLTTSTLATIFMMIFSVAMKGSSAMRQLRMTAGYTTRPLQTLLKCE